MRMFAISARRTSRGQNIRRCPQFFRIAVPFTICTLAFQFTTSSAEGTPTTGSSTPKTASPLGSNLFNPAISVNTLFLGAWSDAAAPDEEAGTRDGLTFQEGEIVFTSVVDPYFQAFVTFAASPEEGAGFEETYVTATNLPRGLGLRAGKFLLPFGKHNDLHLHAYPFVSAPIGQSGIFGPEGANDVGVALSYLLPASFYFDLTGYVVDGQAEIFDPDASRLAVGGRASALVDLSPAATLEFGASGMNGPAEIGADSVLTARRSTAGFADGERDGERDAESATLFGGDLTFKWQDPSQTNGRAFVWQNEWIAGDYDRGTADRRGLYSLARYRALRRTWIGGGYSRFVEKDAVLDAELNATDSSVSEVRAQLAFTSSEFSLLRLEVRRQSFDPGDVPPEWSAFLQLNYTIGSHPAHKY